MVRAQCNAMPSLKLKLMNEEHNLEKLQKTYKIPVVLEVRLSLFWKSIRSFHVRWFYFFLFLAGFDQNCDATLALCHDIMGLE